MAPPHAKDATMRMLLTHRKLLQSNAIAIENDLRGTLRNFGFKVGMVGKVRFEARIQELVRIKSQRSINDFRILHGRLTTIFSDLPDDPAVHSPAHFTPSKSGVTRAICGKAIIRLKSRTSARMNGR